MWLLAAAPVACAVDAEDAADPLEDDPVGTALVALADDAGFAEPPLFEPPLDAVALAVALANFSKPAVIVTGRTAKSVLSGTKMLVPGSLASEPVATCVHVPGWVKEVMSQCADSLNSSASPSEIEKSHAVGAMVTVALGMPQSLESVSGGQPTW